MTVQGGYQPACFSMDDVMGVYTLKSSSGGEDTIQHPAGSILFALDNNGFSADGNTVRLYTADSGQPYTVYLLHGKSLLYNGTQVDPSSDVTVSEFARYVRNNIQATGLLTGVSDQNYYSQLYNHIDRLIRANAVVTENDLEANVEDFTVLCYQVSFAAGAVRDVNVSYDISAGYPSGYTKNESTYDYLLNPARYWASFQQLTIIVIPGPVRNQLTNSSLPFTRNKDGSYSAKFQALPSSDLSFTLKHANFLLDHITIIFIILLTVYILSVLWVVLWRLKCKKR